MKPWFWIRHPNLLPARIRYWVWEKRNPDKPWLTPKAVEFLDRVLTRDMTGLEFGSGRSTAWFAARLRRLTSVEHYSVWYDRVKADLERQGLGNVDYRLVPTGEPASLGGPNPLPRYAAVLNEFPDESLDVVLVDGEYRHDCTLTAPPKLKPGGLLLIDDVAMWPGRRPPVPDGWPVVHESTNGLKETVVWRKPG
jgi:predicted O-methyltransferase YrrM